VPYIFAGRGTFVGFIQDLLVAGAGVARIDHFEGGRIDEDNHILELCDTRSGIDFLSGEVTTLV
jgi:hypothetical protein